MCSHSRRQATPFDSNPRLAEAMGRFKEFGDAQSRLDMLELLLDSQLLVLQSRPGQKGEGAGPVTISGGQELRLVTGRNSRGERAIVAFTDVASLVSWDPPVGEYLALAARDLFMLAVHNDRFESVIINPAEEDPLELGRREFRMLAEGILPATDPSAGDVTHGSFPTKTIIRLRPPQRSTTEAIRRTLEPSIFTNHPFASRFYLFELLIQGGEPHLALGVEQGYPATDQEFARLVDQLSEVLGPLLERIGYVDLMIVEDDLLNVVKETVAPLLSRG